MLPLLYGMTPDEQLIEAAKTGNLQQAQEALNAGADINVQNSWGTSAFYLAVSYNRIDMVKFLAESGAYVDIHSIIGTPLHRANINITKFLINVGGANINAQNDHGQTPLHCATLECKTYVKSLLDVGADINAKDNEGSTPLDWFRKYVRRDDVMALLEDYTALLEQIELRPTKELLNQAIGLGYVHAVKLLLKAGIKPDMHNLVLVKKKYDQDMHPMYKDSYAAIGRMLLQHLRLTGKLQVPAYNVADTNTNTVEYAYGPIAKSGLGLPENVAHTIASSTY